MNWSAGFQIIGMLVVSMAIALLIMMLLRIVVITVEWLEVKYIQMKMRKRGKEFWKDIARRKEKEGPVYNGDTKWRDL